MGSLFAKPVIMPAHNLHRTLSVVFRTLKTYGHTTPTKLQTRCINL